MSDCSASVSSDLLHLFRRTFYYIRLGKRAKYTANHTSNECPCQVAHFHSGPAMFGYAIYFILLLWSWQSRVQAKFYGSCMQINAQTYCDISALLQISVYLRLTLEESTQVRRCISLRNYEYEVQATQVKHQITNVTQEQFNPEMR